MGFVLARRHARTLRIGAVVLATAIPVACIAAAWLSGGGESWMTIAAIAAIAGAFLERWLFFAQARHVVTLYY